MKPIFIAEIKMQSPFGFKSDHAFMELVDTAITHGDWISVHTNPLWGGSYEQLEFIRRLTDKPILAKGIHSRDEDIKKALDYGANHVLVVNRIPYYSWLPNCLLEMDYASAEPVLNTLTDSFNKKTFRWVANARNLKNGSVSPLNTDLDKFLAHKNSHWVCQASGIQYPFQVKKGIDAYLVGTNLVEFCNEL